MIQSISKAVRQVVSKIWPNKKYNRINWQNRPSTATALGATNLNKIDVFCNDVDNALIQMDAGKLNIETANSMLASVSFDSETGKFTFKELDGTTYEYDLNLEKIPVSFTLSEDGILTMTTEDGTEWTCNIADLIKDYVFDDSDTIAFEKEFVEEDDEGKGSYHVTASVKAGSINETHLNPDYRSDILTYTTQAQTAANDSLTYSKDSKRWAVGDSEYEGSATDNAKYYKEQAEAAKQAAEEARDEAQAATGTVIATTEQVGVVKPDGTTIKVDEDGTIHGANQFDGSGYTYVDGEAIDPPSTSDEAILDADKLGGQLPSYYAADANVVKKTDISNVQADSTSTVPSSALLKSTDDKIGDTSNLPGDASDVVSAITQLNSDFQNFHFVTNADLPWLSSGIRIETLNSPSQLTQPGPYTIISMSSNVNSNIESGGTQMTDYSIGDFSAILLSNSITQTNGCRYGILIVTTPRTGVSGSWVIWIGRIWDYKFTNWKQI